MRQTLIVICFMTMLITCNAMCCKYGYDGWCTGIGNCNFFCCNCDGGCEQDSQDKSAQSLFSPGKIASPEKLFDEIDQDHDGFFSYKDAVKFATAHNVYHTNVTATSDRAWFDRMDKNHDGKISRNEFDSSL